MQMVHTYSNFMVFKLKDTGEKVHVDISEEDLRENKNGDIFNPSQVLLIVNEEFRRIYIWKGVKSSVRKKFIASRRAAELQQEMMNNAHFHRCKIISVDQGDEPKEFLKNMAYYKNIDAIKNVDLSELRKEEIPHEWKEQRKVNKIPTKNKEVMNSHAIKTIPKSKGFRSKQIGESSVNYEHLLNKILDHQTTDNVIRKNILLGDCNLYGKVAKTSEIFGKKVVKEDWERIKNLSKSIIELESHKLRIHINTQTNKVEGIEVLADVNTSVKKNVKDFEVDFNRWTVGSLRDFCKERDIEIPSSARKADIVEIVDNYMKKN
ncbi:MAG: hypothetical protein GF317_12995 [Candidatus Lokiarchaeota archaeon]|nr:hypothetical protein [Candidatus Lokiarchaeota archaeon]MBD3200558.1 hypothetical protein [Candidatus Lokiarchaeota archaeon]